MDSSWPFAEFDADSLIYDRPSKSNKRLNPLQNQEVVGPNEMSSQFQESCHSHSEVFGPTEETNLSGVSSFTETENGIDWHGFPLLKLPKGVIEDVARLLSNIDRRHLSQTCRRIHHIFDGSVAEALDRRHVVSVTLYFTELAVGHGVAVWVQNDQYTKYFYKFGNGVQYLRECSQKYAISKVKWDLLEEMYWDDPPMGASQLVALIPDEWRGELHIVCPQIDNDSARDKFLSEMVQQFLKEPTFTLLIFNAFKQPSHAEMDRYLGMVKRWCLENAYDTVMTTGYYDTGFCKRTLNGKRNMILAPRMDYVGAKKSSWKEPTEMILLRTGTPAPSSYPRDLGNRYRTLH